MTTPTLAPGDRFGAYEVVELVGAGGMGEVYRARDTRLPRDVALKILPDHRRLEPQRRARFEREAQLLSSLNHPNIATLHGLEESGGATALVMELVEGETLADMMAPRRDRSATGSGERRGTPLSVRRALEIARQIADALDSAHERGIIHRDLKPANIKVRPDGTDAGVHERTRGPPLSRRTGSATSGSRRGSRTLGRRPSGIVRVVFANDPNVSNVSNVPNVTSSARS